MPQPMPKTTQWAIAVAPSFRDGWAVKMRGKEHYWKLEQSGEYGITACDANPVPVRLGNGQIGLMEGVNWPRCKSCAAKVKHK